MTDAAKICITLDSQDAQFQPGDRLTGRYLLEGAAPGGARAAELSVLWYTSGKGEEDMFVHHFERSVDEPSQPLDLRTPRRFDVGLPISPLSYDGIILKVCWCVRLRLFLPQGQELVAEAPFRLGSVPAPQTTTEAETLATEGEHA